MLPDRLGPVPWVQASLPFRGKYGVLPEVLSGYPVLTQWLDSPGQGTQFGVRPDPQAAVFVDPHVTPVYPLGVCSEAPEEFFRSHFRPFPKTQRGRQSDTLAVWVKTPPHYLCGGTGPGFGGLLAPGVLFGRGSLLVTLSSPFRSTLSRPRPS